MVGLKRMLKAARPGALPRKQIVKELLRARGFEAGVQADGEAAKRRKQEKKRAKKDVMAALAALAPALTATCCADEDGPGCGQNGQVPHECGVDCAHLWAPYAAQCPGEAAGLGSAALTAFFALVFIQATAILLFKLCQEEGVYTFSPASCIAITEFTKFCLATTMHYPTATSCAGCDTRARWRDPRARQKRRWEEAPRDRSAISRTCAPSSRGASSTPPRRSTSSTTTHLSTTTPSSTTPPTWTSVR